MLFTDFTFLVHFLPVLLAAFFLALAVTPRGWKDGVRRFSLGNPVLAGGSLFFVACGSGSFIWWILGAALFNYLVGLAIGHARRPATATDRVGPLPEALLTLAVTGNLVLLGVFKYAAPLPTAFADRAFSAPQLLAPLGLTFIVCHAISYVVDISRGHMSAQGSPVGAALYLLFFPLLCAGPLVRYRDMGPQLAARRATMAAFAYGVRRWLIGFYKVGFLARTLAGPADAVFLTPSTELGLLQAWLGASCFALQIYFDLSGYADMAIGFGRMFGFRVGENFRWPYGATSLTEFWRRWNVTLFDWFRSYVRLLLEPTGAKLLVRARQVMLLFLCVGLWHGPGWNIVGWGMLHGGTVALEQTILGARLARLPGPLRHLYLVLVVLCLWVLFRAESLTGAIVMWCAMFGLTTVADPLPLFMTPLQWTALVVGGLSVAPLWTGFSRWLVTVDALTTSILILVSTSVIFVWRQCVNALRFTTGRRG